MGDLSLKKRQKESLKQFREKVEKMFKDFTKKTASS